MKHTAIKLVRRAGVSAALALIIAGCDGGGNGGNGSDAEDGATPESPIVDDGVFDIEAYAAIPASNDFSGLWMAVHISEQAQGNRVDDAFDVVRKTTMTRRELVRIESTSRESTITYCGEQPLALQLTQDAVSHGPAQNGRYVQQTTLAIEANGTLRMTADSGIVDAGDSLIEYYTAVRNTQSLTLVRIADEVPAQGIGTFEMSWSQTWPDTDAGSSTDIARCFAEQRTVVTVPGVIEDELERFALGTEYVRHVLYIDGASNEFAFAQEVTAQGEPIREEAAREFKTTAYPFSSIWWEGEELINVIAYDNYCFAASLCPPVTLATSQLPQATAEDIDRANATTPLFARQSYTSTRAAITLTATTTDDNGNYLNGSVNLHW